MTTDRKDVFISYARADGQDFVKRLREKLSDNHISTWVDVEDMPSSDLTWTESVRKAFGVVPLLVVVWTPGSVASTAVQDEITMWGPRDFMAVRAAPCTPPVAYQSKKYYDYSTGNERELDRLVREIKEKLPPKETTLPNFEVKQKKVKGDATGAENVPPGLRANLNIVQDGVDGNAKGMIFGNDENK